MNEKNKWQTPVNKDGKREKQYRQKRDEWRTEGNETSNDEGLMRWFQVLTAASMKMTAFWDIVPCCLVEVDLRTAPIIRSPSWWRRCAPLKRRHTSNRLHYGIFQKTVIFKSLMVWIMNTLVWSLISLVPEKPVLNRTLPEMGNLIALNIVLLNWSPLNQEKGIPLQEAREDDVTELPVRQQQWCIEGRSTLFCDVLLGGTNPSLSFLKPCLHDAS
jgi:hypothetical protein